MDSNHCEKINYKNVFDKNIQNNIEVCGLDVCSLPINLIRYIYYKCLL